MKELSDFQNFLNNSFIWVEGFAALIAIFHYKTVKTQYWKYLVFYLIFIFINDCYGTWGDWSYFSKEKYYNYIIIPFEFIFFYWLYAVKSLKKINLFFFLSLLYLLAFIPNEFFFKENKLNKIIYSVNYTFGSLILMILVVLEYYKQVNSDNIINFHKNRMFYINLGVTLFYIGALPLMAFYYPLLREHREIWDIYFDYYIISNITMYLLFSASFIWGKHNS